MLGERAHLKAGETFMKRNEEVLKYMPDGEAISNYLWGCHAIP